MAVDRGPGQTQRFDLPSAKSFATAVCRTAVWSPVPLASSATASAPSYPPDRSILPPGSVQPTAASFWESRTPWSCAGDELIPLSRGAGIGGGGLKEMGFFSIRFRFQNQPVAFKRPRHCRSLLLTKDLTPFVFPARLPPSPQARTLTGRARAQQARGRRGRRRRSTSAGNTVPAAQTRLRRRRGTRPQLRRCLEDYRRPFDKLWTGIDDPPVIVKILSHLGLPSGRTACAGASARSSKRERRSTVTSLARAPERPCP